MSCSCDRNTLIVRRSKVYYCIGCGGVRPYKAPKPDDYYHFGHITAYMARPMAALYAPLGENTCRLEMVTMICNARRCWNDITETTAIVKAACRIEDNDYAPLMKYVPAGFKFVKCDGPEPSAFGFVSMTHCSVDYFPGATLAFVPEYQYRGDGRTYLPTKFDFGASMMNYGSYTVFLTNDHAEWLRGCLATEPAPADKVDLCKAVVATLPEHFPAPIGWLSNKPTGKSLTSNDEGHLKFDHGLCWTQLFSDPENEVKVAACFGYLMPWGAQGAYISRRLQLDGSKLVRNPDGKYALYTLGFGSWIGHIAPADWNPPERFILKACFDVVPYNEPSPLPLYKLPKALWVGGSAHSRPFIPAPPPGYTDWSRPGMCWVKLFHPDDRHAEARTAIMNCQVTAFGVTGSYLQYRLIKLRLCAEVDRYGDWFITHPRGDPLHRHIQEYEPEDDDTVVLSRISIVPLGCRAGPAFNFGFGFYYGRRSRRGGGKATQSSAPEVTFGAPECSENPSPVPTGSVFSFVNETEKPEVKTEAASTPPKPKPRTKPNLTLKIPPTPPPQAKDTAETPISENKRDEAAGPEMVTASPYGALVKRVVGDQQKFMSLGKLTEVTKLPDVPADGSCGLHIFEQIMAHMNSREPNYRGCQRAYENWATTLDVADLATAARIPAGGMNCVHMRYRITLHDSHFRVEVNKSGSLGFSRQCAGFACDPSVPVDICNSDSVDLTGWYEHHNGTVSATEYCRLGVQLCNFLLKEPGAPPPRRQNVLKAVSAAINNKPTHLGIIKPNPAALTGKAESKAKTANPPPPKEKDSDKVPLLSAEASSPTESDTTPEVKVEQAPDPVLNDLATPKPRFWPPDWTKFRRDVTTACANYCHVARAPNFSRFLPYLLSLWNTTRTTLSGVDLAVACVLLFVGLLLSVLPTVVFVVPAVLLCYWTRPHWISYVGPLGMAALFVGTVLLGPSPNACAVDDGYCDSALLVLAQRFSAGRPVRYSLGSLSFVFILYEYFVYVETDLSLLSTLLCLCDLVLCTLWVVRRCHCWRCFAPCIRCAPGEIPLRTVPISRVSNSTLLDICDNFSSPPVDIIRMATGYKGCYRGSLPCVTEGAKPISYSKLDMKKLSPRTVVPFPTTPAEAVKAIHVLNARGVMARSPHTVERVDKLPCKNPFFPYDVNSRRIVAVDAETYSLFKDLGLDLSHLVIGEGDFFKCMGVVRPPAQNAVSGGSHLDYIAIVAWIAFWCILGNYLQAPSPCGYGTPNPFCRGSYVHPVTANQGVCHHGMCMSDSGISRHSLFTLPRLSINGFLLSALIAVVFFVTCVPLDGVVISTLLLLPVNPYCTVFRIVLLVASSAFISFKNLGIGLALIAPLDPTAACAGLIILGCCYFTGRYTGFGGLITPYDIHAHTSNPRQAIAVANAKDGTYLAAVRQAALTGKPAWFIPSNFGVMVEGALRTGKPHFSTCGVTGSSTGTGAILNREGKQVVVTATHVLSEDKSAFISHSGLTKSVKFNTKGDFAIGEVENPFPGDFPQYITATKYEGRAYWLCAGGIDVGYLSAEGAVVFTGPGDSGSAIINASGQLLGIHTGSDANGCGAYTTPTGDTIVGALKLSLLAKHYEGDLVPVEQVPKNVICDVNLIPQPLADILRNSIRLQGGMNTIQLLVTAVVLWQLLTTPRHLPFVVLFFVLNELLPKCIVRGCYNLVLFCLACFTPLAPRILFIRLLTAALNRNVSALFVHIFVGCVTVCADALLTNDIRVALDVSSFYIVPYNTDPFVTFCCGLGVILLSILLEISGYPGLGNLISCNGHFDPAFFMRYVNEGLRDGVGAKIGVEGLTAALAKTFTTEELSFLQACVPAKIFTCATNLSSTLDQYIKSADMKNLRTALSTVSELAAGNAALARLDAFLTGQSIKLNPGDVVVHLGLAGTDIFETYVGGRIYLASPIQTSMVAGTKCTLCKIIGAAESSVTTDGKYLLQNGKRLHDAPLVTTLECDATKSAGERRDRETRLAESEVVGDVTVGGKKYKKMWDKVTGDTYYVEEGATSVGKEEAIKALCLDCSLSEKDIAKLQALITRLQGLTKDEALNC
ncbi:1a replicase protein [Free State vervet virus]|uniref:1a replicase protein n=1 Tax=Free State vervet virus TaxID=1737586 RepID=A0A161D9J9_9NIDO|nr:1a replicase protein [Free State vervet virus]ALS54292.1 1a replicase protein [Free State vervet virus]